MQTNAYPMDSLRGRDPLQRATNWSSRATGDASIEFGRFRMLPRRRQLLADGVPVELGTRAFDLLLVLVEADGALVIKEELLKRVWQGIVVSEDNLRVQVSALRKALGAYREVIHTESGRGYRFIGIFRHSTGLPRPHGSRAAGFVEVWFGKTADNRPVWFQFALVAEPASMVMSSQQTPFETTA